MPVYIRNYFVSEFNGTPIKGVLLTFKSSTLALVPLTTDAQGHAVLRVDSPTNPGPVTIKFTRDGFLPATVWQDAQDWTTPRLDLKIHRDPDYFAGWTYVLDGDTHQGIEGAVVWVNDKQTGVAQGSPNWGKVWIEGKRGVPLAIRAVKDDKYPTTIRLTIGSGDSLPGTLEFKPKVDVGETVILSGTIPNTQIDLYNASADLQTKTLLDSVYLDANARGLTHKQFTTGQHVWVRASMPGYTAQEFWVDIPASHNIPVPSLVKIETPEAPIDGAVPPAETPVPTQPEEPLPASVQAPDPYEWLYPHTDDGKYFTTTQARMYIGNLFIDELNTVQFTYQGNRVPIYGYASEDVDAYGNGRRLVHGQILLNFVSEGYLFTVLAEYQRLMAQKTVRDNEVADNAARLAALRDYLADLLAGSKMAPSKAPDVKSMEDAALALRQQVDQTQAAIEALVAQTPAALDQVSKQLTAAKKLTTAKNAMGVKTRFDIVMKLEGGGREVIRKLEDCVLVSNEQVYDQSGQTLLDAYGFVARRLI